MSVPLLVEIDKLMADTARAAVSGIAPDVSMFDYGRKVGRYEGLEQVKTLIERMLRDRDEMDKHL